MRERTPFHETGSGGWMLLAGLVIAWDSVAPETMSAAFRRGCMTPQGMAAIGITWGVLTAHLFSVLPENRDPFTLAVKAVRFRKAVRHAL